jgi:hypothetical protein
MWKYVGPPLIPVHMDIQSENPKVPDISTPDTEAKLHQTINTRGGGSIEEGETIVALAREKCLWLSTYIEVVFNSSNSATLHSFGGYRLGFTGWTTGGYHHAFAKTGNQWQYKDSSMYLT